MKTFSLLSLAAVAALAVEPVTLSKITVEEKGIQSDLTPQNAPLSATAQTIGGDSAALLDNVAGVSIKTGGGISSLPVIHGMADDRIKINVDGMGITAACPNHMNPALSYVDTTKIASISVASGVTPVSQGGDSIAGSIIVKTKDPVFAEHSGEAVVSGDLTAFSRSNNHARGLAAHANVANDRISFSYAGFKESADSYNNGRGEKVKDTLYKHHNQNAKLAYKLDNGVVGLEVGQQKVDYEGFPNQYMDMLNNESKYGNITYKGNIGKARIEANAFRRLTDHYMNFIYGERKDFNPSKPLGMPMYTKSEETGYAVSATLPVSDAHVIKLGNELTKFSINDWWPPTSSDVSGMGPGTFWNVNNGRRDRLGIFAESDYQWNDKLSTLIGIRTDIVTMNTGDVVGYNTASNMMANDPVDAAAFNALKHKKRDNNVDFTAIARYENSKTHDLEFGFARKMRSPNIYERFAWAGGYGTNPTRSEPIAMDMAMVNWFGDGNGYVGNLHLKPETAYTLSLTNDWHDASKKEWGVRFTPYVTKVFDYIDVDVLGIAVGSNGVIDPDKGYDGITLLKFANHNAILYGADLSAYTQAWENEKFGKGKISAIATYTHTYRTDGGPLYHTMPLNAKVSIDQTLGAWKNGLDVRAVAAKKRVDARRSEPETDGYMLVDVRSGYDISKNVKLDLSITNLFDTYYHLPLGGINTIGTLKGSYIPLSGMGRSANVALTIKF